MKTVAAKFLQVVALSTLIASGAGTAGCGASDKQVKAPQTDAGLSAPLAAAFREEAVGDSAKAIDLYLRALDAAATAPDDPRSVAVMMASLDALVHRSVAGFGDIASTSALVDRVDPNRANTGKLDERLADVAKHAEGPFAAHLVAMARLALAERRGDANNADKLRAATGCVRKALLVGPLAWTPITGARDPGILDRPGIAIPADVAAPGPFTTTVKPRAVNAFGCKLPLYAETSTPGVREVVVDAEVKQEGRIGFGLRSSAPATLRVGGKIAIDRPFGAGSAQVVRFARATVKPGTLRIVVRVGMDQDYETIDVGVWDENGAPLRTHVPAVGSRADAAVFSVEPVVTPAPKAANEQLAYALGALAARDAQSAEDALHAEVGKPNTPPDLLLAYGRAVRLARDLPQVKIQERARAAFERVLETWPASWEAAIEHAVLAGARRGQAEAPIETLGDLEKSRTKGATSNVVDAFEAQVAGRGALYDRARIAFERARSTLAGAPLLRAVERIAFERTGTDTVAFDCDSRAAADRTSLACHNARVMVGDRAGAELELERLRGLSGSPQLYLSVSARSALEVGDVARARSYVDAMNPGDRQLALLYAVKGAGDLRKSAPTARDAPQSLASLLRAGGDDPLAAFEGVAERVVREAQGSAPLANAATAVLAHDERYEIAENGLVHFVMLDVRKMMGTADVESNAQADAPTLTGRDAMRILRRRIFKKDGRILLPDQTPHAAQAHADLSQLETGDAVEAVYEGWGLPGEMGNVGIDTPDLLPERTTVRDARIELRLPRALKGALWSHAALGKAEERTDGAQRVLVWSLKDKPVRRIEYGVPKMDRNAGVSFSTTTWNDVAKGLNENLASLDRSSPEVAAWAHDASKKSSGDLVAAVVAAAGESVKEASGFMLGDVAVGRSGQTVTARTILATHEGSRTWLIVRALRILGVSVDVVVAENDPFSDDPNFPPHFGRFMHPLAVAHVTSNGATRDVWIDADVPGPPLPAGRISPELRGRMALFSDGRINAVPALGGENERDEIDERLTVDAQGNAKGLLTVLLRGRAAQDLAEAMVRIVGNERQRALRGIALAWVPFATIEKVELSSDEGSWQIAIRAELSAPAYAQVEGRTKGAQTWVLPGIDPVHFVFPRPYVSTLGSTYANHASRENALAISRATQYHVRRRIELPEKAQILALPGPFDGKGPLFFAARKISVAKNVIEEDFTLDVSTGTVPRGRYDAFVGEVHRADDAFRASTRVRPPLP